jgi:hypothetical protein
MNELIIAGDRIVDGQGDHSETEGLITRAQKLGLLVSTLEIVPLSKRWEGHLAPHQFKSGASAMAAIKKGRKLLSSGRASLVVIRGRDLLRSGYTKEEREKYMKLYSGKYTPLDGYTRLVPHFLKYHTITAAQFKFISMALFENYSRTWKRLHPQGSLPDERWFAPITKYFRGVDCANPNVDFSGQILLAGVEVADLLRVPKKKRVKVLGNSFVQLSVDGLSSVGKVASYLHLKRAIKTALSEAKIDFNQEFLSGRALLEAYTCYPIVPMGLLLRLGLVETLEEIPKLLGKYEVTITGGLNLDRAAWNLTSLNYIISMREKLLSSKHSRYGLVHGNGSLGNQQGITILGR